MEGIGKKKNCYPISNCVLNIKNKIASCQDEIREILEKTKYERHLTNITCVNVLHGNIAISGFKQRPLAVQ